MVGDPYDADDNDPDCYPGTHVLINLADLRDQAELDAYEVEAVGRRSLEPPQPGDFDPAHYRAHAWAGEFRTIRMSKRSNSVLRACMWSSRMFTI